MSNQRPSWPSHCNKFVYLELYRNARPELTAHLHSILPVPPYPNELTMAAPQKFLLFGKTGWIGGLVAEELKKQVPFRDALPL